MRCGTDEDGGCRFEILGHLLILTVALKWRRLVHVVHVISERLEDFVAFGQNQTCCFPLFELSVQT